MYSILCILFLGCFFFQCKKHDLLTLVDLISVIFIFLPTSRSYIVCLIAYSLVCFQKCSHPSVSGDCVLAVNRTGIHFLSHATVVSEERVKSNTLYCVTLTCHTHSVQSTLSKADTLGTSSSCPP